jgi:hypothetical protein
VEGSIFQLELPFFGLTPEYRGILFNQLHDIVFHGKGGYSFEAVYDFPIWLRKFVHRTMIEWYDKENKNQEQTSGQSSVLQNGVIKAPDYSTKARN